MIRARRPEALDGYGESVLRVWYAAYGSNMDLDRLNDYLTGCRDSRPPARSVAVMLPGLLYFATESLVWTGGRAFYDPEGGGELPARAYLLTAAQFSDIAAQEMYREPGPDLDLKEVLGRGRAETGPGRYETLVCAGLLDGCPVLTFTAPWGVGDVAVEPPAAAYLRHLVAGVVAAHGWSALRAAEYLAGCPGAEGQWTAAEIAALVSDGSGNENGSGRGNRRGNGSA
ncbi:histone deacetylase [Streptomyces sp. NPDC048479]|uniref:histone deacetylase n=1 Tax=Streptomyces sp. NPDC048479 TaxID=3154725 RepID=UPI00343B89E5